MHLKENDLTHSINPRYIVRGRDYFTQGRVSSVTWYADQRTVAANVAGSSGLSACKRPNSNCTRQSQPNACCICSILAAISPAALSPSR